MITMLVAWGVTLSALAVQGTAVAVGVECTGALLAKRIVGIDVWRNGMAVVLLVTILLTGHLVQMAAWAMAFLVAGEFETFSLAFYHSAVNYTTLGYGDIVMSEQWRLLGPLEGAGGTLAFGWSTAAIVTVVIRLTRYRHRAQIREESRGRSQKTREAKPEAE